MTYTCGQCGRHGQRAEEQAIRVAGRTRYTCWDCGSEVFPGQEPGDTLREFWWPRDAAGNFLRSISGK